MAREPLARRFTEVDDEVQLHVRTCTLKLPIFIPEITRPAPYTIVEGDDNMRCHQPAINLYLKRVFEINILK